MIEIKDKLQTVEMLFGGTSNIQYRIPIYQRRYVWDTLNWKSLWTDIENMYETRRAIFTGIIVTRQHSSQGDLTIYDVIDGQQRLTTFQIILCVICRRILNEGWSDTSKIINRARDCLRNDDSLLVNEMGEDLQNKLCPKIGSADEEAFHMLVNWNTTIPPKQDGEPVVYSAYRYFESQIKEYDYSKVVTLYNNITLGINVAQINLVSMEVDDEGDVTPEKLFASLNATGRMLSEFDYLRNDLFLRAGAAGDHLYRDAWLPNFEEKDDLNLDTFLRTFLEANLGVGQADGKEKPFDVYQTQYRKELSQGCFSKFAHLKCLGQDVESEFQQLTAYAKSYRELNTEIDTSESEVGRFTLFCNTHNLQRLDPFLLFLKHNTDELSDVCEILESYIVRRTLCNDNYTSTNQEIYDTICEFFFHVLECGEFNVGKFITYLYSTWPGDPQVRISLQSAKSKDVYFISYIFRQMKNWVEEQIEWLGESTNLQDRVNLLTGITDYVSRIQQDGEELEILRQTFNELWPPPDYFLQKI